VLTVDHRFTLNKPALPSAPSKKSFSSVSSPILAWRFLRPALPDNNGSLLPPEANHQPRSAASSLIALGLFAASSAVTPPTAKVAIARKTSANCRAVPALKCR
jgi:hypothetical protein